MKPEVVSGNGMDASSHTDALKAITTLVGDDRRWALSAGDALLPCLCPACLYPGPLAVCLWGAREAVRVGTLKAGGWPRSALSGFRFPRVGLGYDNGILVPN